MEGECLVENRVFISFWDNLSFKLLIGQFDFDIGIHFEDAGFVG